MAESKAKPVRPEMLAAVKAYSQGKATEAQKDLMLAHPYEKARALKEAGITAERSRSNTDVTANGTNGFSFGWRESYGFKTLADLLDGCITIKICPKGKPDAKPVSVEKIKQLIELLAQVNSGDVEMTPNEAAAKVAGAK